MQVIAFFGGITSGINGNNMQIRYNIEELETKRIKQKIEWHIQIGIDER